MNRIVMILLTTVIGSGSSMPGKKGEALPLERLPQEAVDVLEVLPQNVVIAHRGTTYWAPEETEAAMRWARNTGADYLELDLQRTRDGVLIALHDVDLRRTTNVEELFPERAEHPVSAFTLEELRRLDAGKWFNTACPERARRGFAGQDVLTLEDVVKIAEGFRIVRDESGKRIYGKGEDGSPVTRYEPDPQDNGNRPGIYPETKEPQLFPGMELDLRRELERLGWYHPDAERMKAIPVVAGQVGVANTPARVILQTFSDESLAKLREAFPRLLPTCFLLWLGNEPSDLKSRSPEEYAAKINYGIRQGAVIIGPSIGGEPNRYDDLLEPWQGAMIHRAGLRIHPYSFDTEEQMEEYTGVKIGKPEQNRADGMFTNRADETIRFYRRYLPHSIRQRPEPPEAEKLLDALGYKKEF